MTRCALLTTLVVEKLMGKFNLTLANAPNDVNYFPDLRWLSALE